MYLSIEPKQGGYVAQVDLVPVKDHYQIEVDGFARIPVGGVERLVHVSVASTNMFGETQTYRVSLFIELDRWVGLATNMDRRGSCTFALRPETLNPVWRCK